jgi:hypothetical protein
MKIFNIGYLLLLYTAQLCESIDLLIGSIQSFVEKAYLISGIFNLLDEIVILILEIIDFVRKPIYLGFLLIEYRFVHYQLKGIIYYI